MAAETKAILGKHANTLEDDLREIIRLGRGSHGSEIDREARLGFAARLAGTAGNGKETEQRTDAWVTGRVERLRESRELGRLSQEDREMVDACVEFVSENLKGREWAALALTLQEPNVGLRVSPNLVRSLILSENIKETLSDYKADLEMLREAWPFDFKAKVISYFKDGKPKWGPEHMVPIMDSDIDWKSGKERGWFVFYMLRYEIDTDVAEIKDLPEGFLPNPNPEYEPFGAKLTVDWRGRLRARELYSRTHWRVWHGPIEDFEQTEDGKTKVTGVADSDFLVLGHASLFVPKNVEKAYKDIEEMSPQLRELDNIGYRFVLRIELPGAKEDYEIGEHYEIPLRYSMLKSNPKGDPLLKPLR